MIIWLTVENELVLRNIWRYKRDIAYNDVVMTGFSSLRNRNKSQKSLKTAVNFMFAVSALNPLNPKDPYRDSTATLSSKRCILYIDSTNIGTEYFKHGINSPSFPLQNAFCFIILTYLAPALFTFYI